MKCNCPQTSIQIWLTFVILIIAIAIILTSTRYDYFGKDDKAKSKAFKRVSINSFICFGIILVILSAQLNLISDELFKYILIFGLTSLGFKLNSDYNDLNKD